MNITKINIENFKTFKGTFKFDLNKGVNIIVGDNEAGKSTIIEAIHLTLTGMLNGKYLKNELSQYIFNNEIISEYIQGLEDGNTGQPLPHILIELYIEGKDMAEFEGNANSMKLNSAGFSLKIAFDEKYQREYEDLVKLGGIKTLPIEYYSVNWSSFAREEGITPRIIPIKSALIDSSSNKMQNGSDIYISRIVKEFLDSSEVVEVSQAHRKMKEFFMGEEAIKKINEKIKTASKISDKKVELSVELSSKNAWENSLMTYLEDVPFHYIGKGEQCLIKTKLALGHKKAKEANIILLEEPENHLSYSTLNQLIKDIKNDSGERQVLVSTHSSFVANKLGLEHLILLNNKKTTRLTTLSDDTERFFEKLSGYDTLRLILCKKAILVEGDSDELVVQKAFMVNNDGKLPIEEGIDVISVGTSFLRFLEIAEKIGKDVAVVTDNDGNLEALKKKYANYIDKNAKENIKICFDATIDFGDLKIGSKPFNYNTLEPKLLKVNNLTKLNTVFDTDFKNDDAMHTYMKTNKTECALRIFEADEELNYPQYVLDAIKPDGK
ncbi:ATP-dependent nuclease [Elizabethkingia anophelis]|uniref:ATP-dependent endonuclease n=1 Tax=Elizabethkingia anophelis TaxID=1117645 RepID=A0AAU8V4T1_9FLAO|nr:AAA family ATPase [Elizabethkingia anophelis]AQX00108.1 ATP-dependent endonuclease [Elizabethkingia anophelis]MDV3566375.1 ATP-dependent endonuclease [Elizabethkingia anophelis]MDV3874480.1 ATP-dependent endonuclease [Elizabethkingia anophelis]MDV3970918.1 ATP-dependent endonuclease [Elizabethkingia anophelis]OPB65876.1 ATP-dependent endonuclease [Elizabethkingia anophelis]